MSPSALRIATVPIALLAFGLRLALTFWWMPLTWRLTTPGRSIVLMLAGYAVAIAVVFGIYLAVALRARHLPSDLQIKGASFVAPATAVPRAAMAIMLMFLTGGLVVTERVPHGDTMRLAQLDFALPASIAGVGLFALLAAWTLLYNRPRAILTPDTLTVKGLWTRSVRWDELAPGGPIWPQQSRLRSLLLHRIPVPGAPASVPMSAPVWRMYVDPAFFARVIRHYVEHADDRAGIGTEDGLRKLRQLYGDAVRPDATR